MNPREGRRVRADTEDDEHQGDEHGCSSMLYRAVQRRPVIGIGPA
jgi:hypothetical protein